MLAAEYKESLLTETRYGLTESFPQMLLSDLAYECG